MGYKKIPPVPIEGSGVLSWFVHLSICASVLKKIMKNF